MESVGHEVKLELVRTQTYNEKLFPELPTALEPSVYQET